MDESSIIKRIKTFRLERKLSLEKLAELSGLTKGYLSRIENSTKSPPIATLSKLAGALEVDITEFLTEKEVVQQPAEFVIIKRDDRLRVGGNGKGLINNRPRKAPHEYVYEALAHTMPGKNMEPYLITISNKVPKVPFQHSGEEFIFLLDGKMEFIHGGKKHILEKGDSAYFNASIPHTGRSIDGPTTTFICVIYSYMRI